MATYYLVSGGDGNWNNDSNWSASSGGAGGFGIPNVNTDDVIFDINSMDTDITVTLLTRIRNLTISNYNGTIFLDELFYISLNGSLTSSSLCTIQSLSSDINDPSILKCIVFQGTNASTQSHDLGLITFNTGVYIGTTVTGNSVLLGLVTDWTINGFLYITNNANANFSTSVGNIYLKGSLIDTTTTATWGGTLNFFIEFINTTPVIISSSKTTGFHNINIRFNGTSDISISGFLRFSVIRRIDWIQGNVIVDSAHQLLITNASFTLNTGPIIWNDVIMARATTLTITLESDLLISGAFSISAPSGGSGTNPTNFVSNLPGTPRKLTLLPAATQSLFYGLASADIDSRDGQTIWTFTNSGVNPSGLNWKKLVAPRTFGKTFIN
jgi:hypothetical protein